jgi:hypothetical protein
MNCMKNRLRTALLAGMVLLAVSGFTILTAHAHGHIGGGGGSHHAEHSHQHYSAGEHQHAAGSTCYHHSHDDYDDHHHNCRPVSTTVAPSQANTSEEECQDHDGNWEPSQGD